MGVMPPTDTELERAIASVPGVEAAHVDRTGDRGRSRLRVRIGSGDDAPSVAWAISTTLRERFGIDIDPSAFHPRTDDLHAPMPEGDGHADVMPGDSAIASAAGNGRASTNGHTDRDELQLTRAVIEHLDTRIDVSDVVVTATLAHGGRAIEGHATSVPTQQGILRAVAEATVQALRGLTGDRLVAGVDRVAVSVSGEPAIATVVISVVGPHGDEALLGASFVRDEPQRAVMRATLDALNRRVERWLVTDLDTVAS